MQGKKVKGKILNRNLFKNNFSIWYKVSITENEKYDNSKKTILGF